MTGYDWYVFFLCLLVFTALTALFFVLIAWVVRLTIRLIRSGAEDEAIQREAEQARRGGGRGEAAGKLVSGVMDTLLILLLGLAVACNLSAGTHLAGLPALRVVKSDSMAEKAGGNTYLYENALDDQLQIFDLILTHPLPAPSDLRLYDIVVYETGGIQVIHRIVGIEEPDGTHPGVRRFTLQGDKVPWPDGEAVEYTQMRGIYRGQRVPYIGSLVLFLRSPAGWLCVLLMGFAVMVSPVVERRLREEKERRLRQAAVEEKVAVGEKKNEAGEGE